MTEFKTSEDVLSKALGDSWGLFSTHFLLFILSGLLHGVLTVITLGVLGPPLTVGFVDLIKRCRQGESVSPGDIFSGFSRFAPALVAGLLVAVLIGVGLLLLVIPGLILAAGFLFTFQIMQAEETGPWESMSRSFAIFKENLALTVGTGVVVVLLNSLGSLVVFGSIITGPFSLICLTFVYEQIVSARALPPSPPDVTSGEGLD